MAAESKKFKATPVNNSVVTDLRIPPESAKTSRAVPIAPIPAASGISHISATCPINPKNAASATENAAPEEIPRT